MRFGILLATVIIFTISATALMYEPAIVLFFRLSEPHFINPVKNGADIIIRNDAMGDGDFGTKRRGGRSHAGIDIKAPGGTPVYAAKSGIAFRGNVPTGYGRYVMIYHPDKTQTFYGHLSNWNISSVQKVRRGEVIGFTGKTGNAASKNMETHLHFEVREDGEPQDPRPLIR